MYQNIKAMPLENCQMNISKNKVFYLSDVEEIRYCKRER